MAAQEMRKPVTIEKFCGKDYVVEHLRHGCSTIDKHYEIEYKQYGLRTVNTICRLRQTRYSLFYVFVISAGMRLFNAQTLNVAIRNTQINTTNSIYSDKGHKPL